MSSRDLNVPSWLVMEIPSSSIATFILSVGLTKLTNRLRSEVPAWDALMPDLDIASSAVLTSSKENPAAAADGPMYFRDSPRSLMEMVPAFAASTMTSATRAESAADMPNIVMASATIVETVERCSPDAEAASRTPSIPLIIWVLFHPAFPISTMAAATSVELKTVSLPSWTALPLNASNSLPVAPVMAPT